MEYLYYFLFMCVMSACQQKNNSSWQTIDYRVFTLKAPPGWKKVKCMDFEDYAGGLSDGKDTLTFIYGKYSPELDVDSSGIYLEDIVNGLSASIGILPGFNRSATMEIYLKYNREKFSISGVNLNDVVTALRIFKTIQFPEGDSTVNTPLVMERFRPGPMTSGRTLYRTNCISCHDRRREFIGHPFREILLYRDEQWIHRFLTDRPSIKPDSLMAMFHKNTGNTNCPLVPSLSRAEVGRIINYIK